MFIFILDHIIHAKYSHILYTHHSKAMFFGKQIQSNLPLSINTPPYPTLQINNVALAKSSQEAQLYLKVNEQEILICELNRSLGILHNSLNLLVDIKDSPTLITKNGNVHVCGYFQQAKDNHFTAQSEKSATQTATNKKSYSLESKFQKAETLPHQTPSTSINLKQHQSDNEKKSLTQIQQNFTPRQSSRSRLSSRRTAPLNPEPTKPSVNINEQKRQKVQKKQQKQQKKSNQEKALLSNGRYNLKALLQNIDDDESDEQSEVVFDEEEEDDSDDDDQFDEDDSEEEEQQKKPKKKVKQATTTDSKTTSKTQEQAREKENQQKPSNKAPIEVIEEQESEKRQDKKQQFQEKWPQNFQEHQTTENHSIEQKIQELAGKLKVPTIKPMI